MDDTLEAIEAIAVRLDPLIDSGIKAVDHVDSRALFLAGGEVIDAMFSDYRGLVARPPLGQATPEQKTRFSTSTVLVDGLFMRLRALQQQFSERSVSPNGTLASLSRHASEMSLNSERTSASRNVRLPKISLPSFNGTLKSWPTFYDLFNTLIHTNESLSNIERFQYLISSLSGEPLSLVKHLPLTAANYLIAYDSLVGRYQNERALVTLYWKAIWDAAPVVSDSASSVRELLNTFGENLVALKQFPNVDLWAFTLLNIFLQRLDSATRKRFEIKYSGTSIPSFEDAKSFVLDQCRALEANTLSAPSHGNSASRAASKPAHVSRGSRSLVSHSGDSRASSSKGGCPHCKESHLLYSCSSFQALSPRDRFNAVRSARLCINCLRSGHVTTHCSSTSSCKHCKQRHHSLLHFPKSESSEVPPPVSRNLPPVVSSAVDSSDTLLPGKSVNVTTSLASATSSAQVVLATALVQVRDRWGAYRTLRALIDPASQASFLTDASVRQLGLSCSNQQVPVFGLGLSTPNSTCGVVSCLVRAKDSLPLPEADFIVLRNICGNLPDAPVNPREFQDSRVGDLADPNWYTPGPIQMLLGADLYPAIVREGLFSHGSGHPLAMNTIFGWALLGPFQSSSFSRSSLLVRSPSGLDESLRRFWEIEEVPSSSSKSRWSPDELEAETCFRDTVYQLPSGRFGVSLPFKGTPPSFVNSKQIADRRWLAIERRLANQPQLRELYEEFMRDYLQSGHMTLLDSDPPESAAYYIPHHPIVKDEDGKAKIRVVFDASARASNHVALNETLLIGPKLQQDLVSLLLRFRSQPVVFTCDVRQMYRQVLVVPEHRRFQLIRFRFTDAEPIHTYMLNTITYGVSSAPFLAVRTVLHLAEQRAEEFPLAAEAVRHNLYVDDLLCGAASVEAALRLQRELIDLFESGCFELRKWASNRPDLLRNVPADHCRTQPSTFEDDSHTGVKVLGLQWRAVDDSFSFDVRPNPVHCTKRSILSEIARIYDPLGFLSPLSFFAKCIIQRLWKLGVDWDDSPPDSVCQEWERFVAELPRLSQLRIPRHALPSFLTDCQLHAFCDASEAGYACVLYARFVHDGRPMIRFLIAKSKVAPVKLLTVPRLELCAAVLLADLVSFTVNALSNSIKFDTIHAWTDSTVVLSWLRSPSHRWKTFVAHRVERIQQRVPSQCWRHVGTADNPADPASRGQFPEEILSSSLWWSGPRFLSLPPSDWPQEPASLLPCSETSSEERKLVLVARVHPPPTIDINRLFVRFSSLRKIQGVIAYCMRFIHNYCKVGEELVGPLSHAELHSALIYIVRWTQRQVFADEIARLRSGKPCSKQFRKLSPFFDRDDVLRVGGRLAHCPELPFSTRHPALLPSRHVLTGLLIRQVHHRHYHPGVNNTCYLLQQNFWVFSARRAVRHYLAKCYQCYRTRPQTFQPVMGNLPAVRMSQLKPFSVVGVDYGGPFAVLMSRGRGIRTTKAYICLFVCFATKALHVEVASDLSTDTFVAALRRFIARRGRCSTIFSDNGTNFVGANKQLTHFMRLAVEGEAITWRFNPPSSPHFGGLWESGIKSVKTHLSRVVGDQILTFEELTTLVTQVESLLNSRPLCALSTDPNDLSPLTPGHFLTLEPLTAPPDPDLSHLSRSKLSRWQMIQFMHQQFWARWRDEYLHTLYQRGKWCKDQRFDAPDVGTLVLLKDDNAPPLKWRVGRIDKLFPGKDGIARVADVRTPAGVLRRPLVKLCPLPGDC